MQPPAIANSKIKKKNSKLKKKESQEYILMYAGFIWYRLKILHPFW